jgi:hypothetical protein
MSAEYSIETMRRNMGMALLAALLSGAGLLLYAASLAGAGGLWAARFPLLFLFFMIPIPEGILRPIVRFLQAGSRSSWSR